MRILIDLEGIEFDEVTTCRLFEVTLIAATASSLTRAVCLSVVFENMLNVKTELRNVMAFKIAQFSSYLYVAH